MLVVMSVGTVVQLDAEGWEVGDHGLQVTNGDELVAWFRSWDWVAKEEAVSTDNEEEEEE